MILQPVQSPIMYHMGLCQCHIRMGWTWVSMCIYIYLHAHIDTHCIMAPTRDTGALSAWELHCLSSSSRGGEPWRCTAHVAGNVCSQALRERGASISYKHIFIYRPLCVYLYVYTYIYIDISTGMQACTSIHAHIHSHLHTLAHSHTHTYS